MVHLGEENQQKQFFNYFMVLFIFSAEVIQHILFVYSFSKATILFYLDLIQKQLKGQAFQKMPEIIFRSADSANFLKQQAPISDDDFQRMQPIQNPPGLLNKFLTFHHLAMYFNFIKNINFSNFKKYTPPYEAMITNTSLWEKYVVKLGKFNIFRQILRLEVRGLISLLITSFLAGLTFLVGVYLQFFLIDAITIKPNHRDAWIYGGIMLGFMFVKNFLFSYAENLSNNISSNVKIHLQNTFIKSLLESGSSFSKQKLQSIFYYDISMVRQLFLFIPYIIVCWVQIGGSIVFIFVNSGVYGLISLGMLIVMLIIQGLLNVWMYKLRNAPTNLTDKRTQYSMISFRNLMVVSFLGLNKAFQSGMQKLRKKQSAMYGKYSFIYSINQMIGYAYPTITIIIFYTLFRDKTLTLPITLKNVFYLGVMYFPIRVLVFASTIILSAKRSLKNINNSLSFHKLRPENDQKTDFPPTGLMPQDLGACYRKTVSEQEGNIMKLKIIQSLLKLSSQQIHDDEQINDTVNIIQKIYDSPIKQVRQKHGQNILLTGRADCRPSTFNYINKVINQLSKNETVAILSKNPFILQTSLRNNITLFSAITSEKEYIDCLKLVGLYSIFNQFEDKDNTLLSSNSVKNIKQLSLRIELARAIYQNVDYLVISRGLVYNQYKLIHQIFEYRKKKGKTNIILNNIGPFLSCIDYVILITNQSVIKGSVQKMYLNKQIDFGAIYGCTISQYNQQQEVNIVDQGIINDDSIRLQRFIKMQIVELSDPKISNSKALALTQHKNIPLSIIIVFAIFITAFFKHYILILVPTTLFTSPNIYNRLLWSAVTFLILVFVRGVILSIYLSYSSSELSMRLLRKFYCLSVSQIIRLYNRKQTTNIQLYISSLMNQNLFRDVQIGFYLVYQIISTIVMSIIKSNPMAAIIIPLIIILGIFTTIYLITLTNMLLFKYKKLNNFYLYISDILCYNKVIMGYRKSKQFFNKFTHENRSRVIFDLNQIWILLGQRFINEFVVIIFYLIILIVMIQAQFTKITRQNILLIQTAIGLTTQVSNTLRYFLKLKRCFQMQVIGFNKVLRIIEQQPNPQKQEQQLQQNQYQDKVHIHQFNVIEFQNITIEILGLQICRNVNLKIKAMDRIVITGADSLAKQAIFGMFNNIYKGQGVTGRLIIDNIESQKCIIENYNVITSFALYPKNLTIFQVMKIQTPNLTIQRLQESINLMCTITGLKRLFDASTVIESLSYAQRDLLVFMEQSLIKQCQILVIAQGFIHLDNISLLKILNYLINNKSIRAIIHISTNPSVIELYQTHLKYSQHLLRLESSN